MQQIDINEILASKSRRLANKIPKFVIDYLTRLIRVKKINDILARYSNQPPMDFIDSAFDYIGVRYEVFGVENIPNDRMIFAANHPLGGLDGLALLRALDGRCKNGVKIVVNDLLMHLEPLQSVFVPINKHGKQSDDNVNKYNEAFESDLNMITFPSGMCSRLVDGQISDLQWKTSFIYKAISTNRLIVPTFVEGRNSKAFYRLAKWRKRLKIKANLEMITLPKEMFDQKNKWIKIYVGKPIKIDNSKTPKEWTEIVRKATYALNPNSTKF